MWKYNTHIPCHDIRVGDIVRLDIDYDTGSANMHCSSIVNSITSNYTQIQCTSSMGRLYYIYDSKFSPVWINGNICRTCIYYREEDGVEI